MSKQQAKRNTSVCIKIPIKCIFNRRRKFSINNIRESDATNLVGEIRKMNAEVVENGNGGKDRNDRNDRKDERPYECGCDSVVDNQRLENELIFGTKRKEVFVKTKPVWIDVTGVWKKAILLSSLYHSLVVSLPRWVLSISLPLPFHQPIHPLLRGYWLINKSADFICEKDLFPFDILVSQIPSISRTVQFGNLYIGGVLITRCITFQCRMNKKFQLEISFENLLWTNNSTIHFVWGYGRNGKAAYRIL